jgi:hypothetical protein
MFAKEFQKVTTNFNTSLPRPSGRNGTSIGMNFVNFEVLLAVHLSIILVINQLNAHILVL